MVRSGIRFLDFLVNSIVFSVFRVNLGDENKILGRIFLRGRKISIGSQCKLYSGARYNPIGGDFRIILYSDGGTISIGDNVGISNSSIFSRDEVKVEDNVRIGGGCKIWDTDFHSLSVEDRIFNGDINAESAPVYIRRNAFVGAGSLILKGVEIGEGAAVAAHSVVTKSIPSGELWGGNPCKKIRDLE